MCILTDMNFELYFYTQISYSGASEYNIPIIAASFYYLYLVAEFKISSAYTDSTFPKNKDSPKNDVINAG